MPHGHYCAARLRFSSLNPSQKRESENYSFRYTTLHNKRLHIYSSSRWVLTSESSYIFYCFPCGIQEISRFCRAV